MRIVALLLAGQAGPVESAYIECGDITVLLGPNDTGKSRVLRAIGAALADEVWHFSASVTVYATATESELHDYATGDDSLEDRLPLDMPNPRVADALGEELAPAPSSGAQPVAFMLPTEGLPLAAWRYGAEWTRLTPTARRRLAAAGVSVPSTENDLASAPIPLAAIGALDRAIAPSPVPVPAPVANVVAQVSDSIVALCRALRLLSGRWQQVDEAVGELSASLLIEEELPDWAYEEHPDWAASARWLLVEEPGTAALHPYLEPALRMFEILASAVLPDFVTDRYSLCLTPAPVAEVARENALSVDLVAADGVAFPLEHAASGLMVWIQLALRETAARLHWYAAVVDEGPQRAAFNLVPRTQDGEPVRDSPEFEQADAVRRAIELVLGALTHEQFLQSFPQLIESAADARVFGFAPDGTPYSEWALPPPRSRLYLLDEPEQRLHPALQRRAAEWLSELMSGWGAQCILATHAAAFIDLPGEVRLHELTRAAGAAVVRPLDRAELTPHALLAHEMGWDRGEMLGRYRAFLFVEGNADRAVIEELFGKRLSTAKILVLPVHGQRHHAGLLDMELLLIGTAAPVAALFDGISEREIQRIRSDRAHRQQQLQARDARGTVARIVEAEFARGREIELLTVGKPDIVDLLAEESIRAVVNMNFPEHREVRREFQHRGGGNEAAYKRFLWERYRVPASARGLGRIARHMREHDLIPGVLDDLISRVERLAL